jgi:hypothetical protein
MLDIMLLACEPNLAEIARTAYKVEQAWYRGLLHLKTGASPVVFLTASPLFHKTVAVVLPAWYIPPTLTPRFISEKLLKAGHCTLVLTIVAGLIVISNQEDTLFIWLVAWSASGDGTRMRLYLKWLCLSDYFNVFEPNVLMGCLWLEMWWPSTGLSKIRGLTVRE